MSRTKTELHTMADYIEWHRNTLEPDIDYELRYYEAVAPEMCRGFRSSGLWQSLLGAVPKWGQDYRDRTDYALWASDESPELVSKSRESFALKVFRKNFLENERFPDPPADGWIDSGNWFARTNDVVRTCLIVRYLDGVEDVCRRTRELASQLGYEVDVSFEARDEGYYAAHMLVRGFEFRVPSRTWDYTGLSAPIEIQVTTQVKDVIRDLTHRYYEVRRQRPESGTKKWQWEYRSDEFAANYLGHTLHYLEGTIMDIRERAKRMGD